MFCRCVSIALHLVACVLGCWVSLSSAVQAAEPSDVQPAAAEHAEQVQAEPTASPPQQDNGEDAWMDRAISESNRAFWSFQPLSNARPPRSDSTWPANAVDAFVLARLQEQELAPSDRATRRVLIRRLYLDLIGLPPTPEQVQQFVASPAPDAYERLVDRLLASPEYGHRWARYWLDVARFAESHGFEQDYDRPYAYHYRDFVIRAFNADMSYDQFVRWQLAGDEVAPDEPLALMATGFLGAGVFPTQITANEVERTRYDALDDMAATTGVAMLGLTIGCARCHDHKFDPITQGDYYRFASVFTTTVRSEIDLDLQLKAGPPETAKVMVCSEGYQPIRHHTQGADYFEQTYYLHRGDTEQKQGVAQPGYPQVLMRTPEGVEHWQVGPPEGWRTSYRRRSLADWIVDTEHGPGHLLARVIVNRLWQHHLGQGIVATPSDFGAQGARPTHPELLDWLAGQLIANHWQLKPIHRLIVTSATYRQSGEYADAKWQRDPQNQYYWRFQPRRLEAEPIRDSMLAVSGLLDRTMYGPGTLDESHRRRSIYFMIKRSKLIPVLQLLDQPEPLVSVGGRPTTTIAPQALLFMNSPHVRAYAEAFARQLLDATPAAAPQALVDRAYRVALARPAEDWERDQAVRFIAQQERAYGASPLAGEAADADALGYALADFCQVLMSTNEFVYME